MPRPASALADLPRRLLAILILFVALGSLRIVFEHYATVPRLQGFGARLGFLGGYFTVLTTCLVAVAMTAEAMNRRIGARAALALVVAVTVAGIVYHLLLARLSNPQGLHWWASEGLHTGLPVLCLIWWWAHAPRGLTWADVPAVLVWPLFYAVYALTRGALTGAYPYPFLDAATLGWVRLTVNLLGLGLVFAACGAALAALSHRFPR